MEISFSPASIELSAPLLTPQLSPLHFFYFFFLPFELLPTNCASSRGNKAWPDTFLSAALLLHGWASLTYLLGRAGVGKASLAALLSVLVQRDPTPSPPGWHVGASQGSSFPWRQGDGAGGGEQHPSHGVSGDAA